MSLPYNPEKGSSEVPIDEKYGLKSDTTQHVETVRPDRHGHQNITSDGVAHIDASVAAGVAANVEDYETLIAEAEEATKREANMTMREAFRTYPKVSELVSRGCSRVSHANHRLSAGPCSSRPPSSWRDTTPLSSVPSLPSVSDLSGQTRSEQDLTACSRFFSCLPGQVRCRRRSGQARDPRQLADWSPERSRRRRYHWSPARWYRLRARGLQADHHWCSRHDGLLHLHPLLLAQPPGPSRR